MSSTVESELQGNAADLASTIAGLREAKADLLHCLDEKMTEAQALSAQISQLSTVSEDLKAQLGRAEDRTQVLQDTLDQVRFAQHRLTAFKSCTMSLKKVKGPDAGECH